MVVSDTCILTSAWIYLCLFFLGAVQIVGSMVVPPELEPPTKAL